MRLLNTSSLKLESFAGDEIPEYAILSHRWETEEILFEDIQTDKWHQKKGAEKVKKACLQAYYDGFLYIWVDTCCINKSSSAELSEAINSMFNWYHRSQVCYAYLCDVPTMHFTQSEWFSRGWTLQELIAPKQLEFFDSQWRRIGNRLSLLDPIVNVTAIDRRVLNRGQHDRYCPAQANDSVSSWYCRCGWYDSSRTFHQLLSSFSVATRMSWASGRVTTRVEDQAYALLGLFNVNMPLLYGEGTKAFRRLQEEIIRISNDQSILASQHQLCFNLDDTIGEKDLDNVQDAFSHLFPPHPRAFRYAADLERPHTPYNYLSMTLTNRCLNIDLHVCPCMWKTKNMSEQTVGWLGILDCVYLDDCLSRPAILLARLSSAESDQHVFTRIPAFGETLIRMSPGDQRDEDGWVQVFAGKRVVWYSPTRIEMTNIDLLIHPPVVSALGTRVLAIKVNPTIGGHSDMAYRIRASVPELYKKPNGYFCDVTHRIEDIPGLAGVTALMSGLLAIDDGSRHGFFVAYGFSRPSIPSDKPPHYWCRLLAWHQVVPSIRGFLPQDHESAVILQDMARTFHQLRFACKSHTRDSMEWPGRPGLRAQVAMTRKKFLGQTLHELEISVWRLEEKPKAQVIEARVIEAQVREDDDLLMSSSWCQLQ
ncbi:hypothetical protein CEP54_006201 [Fusarium duplospermum]|uniref:Heterokaryon incompatibility domain-containing protein n=1 Tax=Fusarium duplospermum TaxID=1325734 RepID=A0A428Q838_9HYPO|nr:hypothetical protein CEP54_006201 [Fusarium duplospermum]